MVSFGDEVTRGAAANVVGRVRTVRWEETNEEKEEEEAKEVIIGAFGDEKEGDGEITNGWCIFQEEYMAALAVGGEDTVEGLWRLLRGSGAWSAGDMNPSLAIDP